MSVSRVVIRLEIADNCDTVDLQYQAKELETGLAKTNYALVVAGSANGRKVQLTKEETQIFKGRRFYQTITIETYSKDMDTSLDVRVDDNRPNEVAGTHQTTDAGCEKVVDRHQVLSVESGNSETEGEPGSGKHRPVKGQTSSAINFFSGNPAVETTEGILHLYKEDRMTCVTGDVRRSEMVCMLNIPASLTSRDLIQYVAPIGPDLEHIKIIRGSTPNEYMVLLKFRSQTNADEFFNTFNNKPFNSIEPEICHMVYVARVETLHSSEGAGLQIPGVTELPVCTVCLERMDESVDGVLTILCNHSFHSACLANWDDTSCPVCRYIQTPVAVADNKCFHCDAQENLWICLICGVVGCGRYANGHAYDHFKETSHTYSMQLGSNRVWDYAGDNYVHRLVQNKTDGKLVEVDERGNLVHEEKVDSLALEYTYLLTNQLESQRNFFEEKIQFIEKHKNHQIEEMEAQIKKALEECAKRDQQLTFALREKQVSEKRCNQLAAKVKQLTSDLEEEKEMNSSLRKNQLEWQAKVNDLEQRLAKKDVEISEIQDQLRDVMFYLDAKNKLESTDEVTQQEIQEGQIVVQPNTSASAGPSGGGSRKGRKKGR